MAFNLPFETEIIALDERLAALTQDDPAYIDIRARLAVCERQVYPNLSAYETFLLSGNPLRPKTLDYIRHIFHDVTLFENEDVRGDHLMVAGEGKIEIAGKHIDVMIVGQQTAPSSRRDDLLKLPASEYKRWNQGMGFPDSYRKAVYAMELAEQRGWPVMVFVDTPGADPSEYAEEEGQAFAINDVIHKTTSLKVPNLSYIISLGASGGAIAITATNRTIMNQYATYMVISPGGCASILFRNRSPESIRKAAEGLCLTSKDALEQGTVDEIVEEGLHPGHRYPNELLETGREAVARNLAMILELDPEEVEETRRRKFFGMGRWGTAPDKRAPDVLAKMAAKQDGDYEVARAAFADYVTRQSCEAEASDAAPSGAESANAQGRVRLLIARAVFAIEKEDAQYLSKALQCDMRSLSPTQWKQLHEYALELRYGDTNGSPVFHPNGGQSPYRRLHPVDWIRRIADPDSFGEFAETIQYCSVDQLAFPQYEQALERGVTDTGLYSGVITGTAKVGGHEVVLAINNFGLAGSSLCDEIGEKFRIAAQHALETRTPFIAVAMGGGARMQEGTPSMHRNIPKAQHALNLLEESDVPYISVICDPTLGGTAISYGLRGDLMIVVKGSANIGFSGKRVVEQFQQRKVAPDFQHEAWLLRRGFVDEGVATDELAGRLAELLKHVAEGGKLTELRTRTPRPWTPTKTVKMTTMNPKPGGIVRQSSKQRGNVLGSIDVDASANVAPTRDRSD